MSSIAVFAVFATVFIALSFFYLFFYRSWRRERELKEQQPAVYELLCNFYRIDPGNLAQG